jgi:membrane protease YdiL (CAAX protease family)
VVRGGLPCLARADPQTLGAATKLIGKYFPWLSGGALVGAAAVSYPGQAYLLTGLLLFLPLADRSWQPPDVPRTIPNYTSWAALSFAISVLLVWKNSYIGFAANTLLFAALPEEWFFRAYFMDRIGKGWRSNLVASLLFSFLHGLTRGWATGLLVLAPSLLYGWLYQRTRDLPLLVLLHALSNLIFVLFLQQALLIFMGGLL